MNETNQNRINFYIKVKAKWFYKEIGKLQNLDWQWYQISTLSSKHMKKKAQNIWKRREERSLVLNMDDLVFLFPFNFHGVSQNAHSLIQRWKQKCFAKTEI